MLNGCALLEDRAGGSNPATALRDCAAVGESPLQWWRSITQARLSGLGAQRDLQPTGPAGLSYPVAIAAYVNDLFIADAGRRAVYRFDQAADALSVFAPLDVDPVAADLYLDDDLSLYVVDARSAQVLRFDASGRLVQRFANSANLSYPVAVVADRRRARVLVADRLYAHVLEFNQLGTLTGTIRLRSPLGTAVAMARQGDDLYVVDQQAHRVQRVALDRDVQTQFGAADLERPVAVAADRYGRVFVADDADNRIKVFLEDELEAVAGGRELGWGQIADLWIDAERLYVADGLSSRVLVFNLLPPCS